MFTANASAYYFSKITTITTQSTSSFIHATPTPPGTPQQGVYLKMDGSISNRADYLLGAYFPVLVSILFSLPWLIVDRTLRSLEPFHQLYEPTSATRAFTQNFMASTAPWKFFQYHQWNVAMTSTLMFLSLLITPLGPEAMSIHADGECSATTDGCTGRIGVFIPVARTIQTLLVVMAIITAFLALNMRHRELMLRLDPRSIAGTSLLLLNPTIQRGFIQLCDSPKDEKLRAALLSYTSQPGNSTVSDGELYDPKGLGGDNITPMGHRTMVVESARPPSVHWETKLTPAYRGSTSCLPIFILGLAALILAYHYTSGDNGFERFMDSQGFGVRMFFTVIGVLISYYWRHTFEGRENSNCKLAGNNAADRRSRYRSPCIISCPRRR